MGEFFVVFICICSTASLMAETNTSSDDTQHQLAVLKSMPLFYLERNGSNFTVSHKEVPVFNSILNPDQSTLEENTVKLKMMPLVTVYLNGSSSNITEDQQDVFSSAATCPYPQFSTLYTSVCQACPIDQVRTLTMPWAPMAIRINGPFPGYKCEYYRMANNQPVYKCENDYFVWWWVYLWLGIGGYGDGYVGSTTSAANGASPGGYWENGEPNPVTALLAVSTEVQWCVGCSSGKYSIGSAALCANCPSGTYSTAVGAIASSACSPCSNCPAAQYKLGCTSTNPGTCVACQSCAANQWLLGCSGESAGTCLPCSQCSVGQFLQGCPGGSDAASGGCYGCGNGLYSAGLYSRACSVCLPGKYSVGQVSSCSDCSAGSYSTAWSVSLCVACPIGTYSTASGLTVSSACTSCPVGTYSGTLGAATISACSLCSAGKYSDSTKSTACAPCLPGAYSSGTGGSVCSLCPIGMYSSIQSMSSCTSCSAGNYAGLRSSSVCTLCPPGAYSTGMGGSVCALCPAGTFSAASGAISVLICDACIPGTFSTALGTPSTYAGGYAKSVCALCSAGTYATGVSRALACDVCQPGTYSTAMGMSSICGACPVGECLIPGQYSTCGRNQTGNCSMCQNANLTSTTYYSVSAVTGFNSSCPVANSPVGYYRNCTNPRAPMWINSPPVVYGAWCMFRDIVNGQPYYFCSNTRVYMWWQTSQWVGSTDFSQVGTANFMITGPSTDGDPVVALLSIVLESGVNWETACLRGTYSPLSSSTACTLASAGYYVSSSGASAQTPCAVGTYSSPRASSCSDVCPAGTYKAPLSQCLPATPGSYSDSGALTPCLRGTFSSMSGLTVCTSCMPGTFNDATGGNSSGVCSLCSMGGYSSSAGASVCTACASGKYNAAVGVTVCAACPIGKFSNVEGLVYDCSWCTAGINYAFYAGSSQCTTCSLSCGIGKQIQGPCTLTTDTFCGACTPVANCVFLPGAACGNSSNPNCVCLPGFELIGRQCQQCKQGFFKSMNTTLPCSQWTLLPCSNGYFRSNGTRFIDTACLPCPSPPGNSSFKGAACEWGCRVGFNNTVFK